MRTRALMDYWQIDELLLGQIEHPGQPGQLYPGHLDLLDHDDLGHLYLTNNKNKTTYNYAKLKLNHMRI